MDQEQARLTQEAAAYAAASLRDDTQGADLMFEDLKAEPRGPEGLLYLALVAGSSWCLATGKAENAVEEFWPHLPPPKAEFAELADRQGITTLGTALRVGSPDEIVAAQNRINDTGVIWISALDLAMASLEQLEQATSVPATEWCRRFAEGLAAGTGVDE